RVPDDDGPCPGALVLRLCGLRRLRGEDPDRAAAPVSVVGAAERRWPALRRSDRRLVHERTLVLPARRGRDVDARIRRTHTYGGVQVSTWSVLRQSCKPRSPVGLVNQPGKHVSADRDLALAA